MTGERGERTSDDAADPPDAPLAVFDLDSTLSDTGHRDHHLQGRRDWDAFFSAAGRDEPLPEGVAAARAAADAGCRVVYLTGRPELLRAVSQAWLTRHDLPGGMLLMRADGSREPAVRFKLRELRRLARSSPIAIVVDDDLDVIDAVQAARVSAQTLHATWQVSPAGSPRPPSTR